VREDASVAKPDGWCTRGIRLPCALANPEGSETGVGTSLQSRRGRWPVAFDGSDQGVAGTASSSKHHGDDVSACSPSGPGWRRPSGCIPSGCFLTSRERIDSLALIGGNYRT
jgi:hypothetical protein